ncbi:MAG TPA: ABC transporter permease, partial [Bryobacteraceae bacterium]
MKKIPRLRVLIRKEFNQIRRDRRLAVSLIIPPTLQILLFGFALDSTVTNLRLGVVDYSHTPESREMISSFTESKSFRASGSYGSVRDLERAISESRLDAGMVVPYSFAREIRRGRTVDVQIILNAANANTATIGQGYAAGLIQAYNGKLAREGIRPVFREDGGISATRRGSVTPVTAFLYNPG